MDPGSSAKNSRPIMEYLIVKRWREKYIDTCYENEISEMNVGAHALWIFRIVQLISTSLSVSWRIFIFSYEPSFFVEIQADCLF